jgi:RNA polymerase sigma factor for flagellar operon FliA
MGCEVRDLTAVEGDVRRAAVLSLQALTADGGDAPVSGGAQPETLLLQREQIGCLRDAIAELPERLRAVVIGHFFEQRKMTDIAAELGVTESRISQLRSEALSLLRDALQFIDGADAVPPVDMVPAPVSGRAAGRAAVRTAYCAAVASRSSLAGRLAVTTVLGETRDAAGADLRPAN